MKNLALLAVLLFCLCITPACKKEKSEKPAVITECLEIKFEEFKQLPGAAKIIRINRPSGALYWLVNDMLADEGEPVLNEQCEVVCTQDCYCAPGTFLSCNDIFQNVTSDVIWER